MDVRMNDINTTHNETYDWIKPYAHTTAMITLILAILIIATNGVIIIVYARDRKLRTASHFFLMNLVLADFLVGLALPLHGVTFIIPDSSLNAYICLSQFSLLGTPLGVSVLSLLLITIDRFMSVVCPFRHGGKCSKPVRIALIVTSWLAPAVILTVAPTTWELPKQFSHIGCSTTMDFIPKYYWKALMLPAVFLISAAMLMMYVKILNVARHQIQSIHLLVVQVSPSDRKRIQNIRLARTGFIMLGLFLICWLPFITVTTAREYNLISDFWLQNPGVGHVASFLPVLLSAINPFIYATRIHRFKIQIKRLLRISIKSEERYEKYEIRQSFMVRRNDAMTNSILGMERSDSGVGISNEAYSDDDVSDQPTLTAAESYQLFRQNRALSRISESPESHVSTPTSDWDYRFTPPGITENSIQQQEDNLPTAETMHKNVLQAQEDNTSLCSIESSNRHSQDDKNVLFPAPVTVNCDSDSEYFKLVVRRVVHCSDDDSDPEDAVRERATKSKKKQKNSLIPTISVQRSGSTVSYKYHPENGGTLKSKADTNTDRTVKPVSPKPLDQPDLKPKRAVHKRTTSTVSVTSMMFNNDEVTVEVVGDKKAKRLNSGITPIPSPRLNHDSTAQLEAGLPSTLTNGDSTYSSRTQKCTLLHDIWQGTMSRLKKSRPPLPLNKMTSMQAELSSNVAIPSDNKNNIIHKRSRSALEDGVIDYSIYPSAYMGRNTLQLPNTNSHYVPKRPRSRHTSLSDSRDEVDSISITPASNSSSSSDNQLTLSNRSVNHIVTSHSPGQGSKLSHTRKSIKRFDNPVHKVHSSDSMTRSNSRKQAVHADLVLPIKFCLASGLEEGGFITKKTIYRPSNLPRNVPKPIIRERSGSQPNLHERTNNSSGEKQKISRQKSASASLISNGQQSD